MRILVLADIHGEYAKLGNMLGQVDEKFDLVVCPGDFTDMYNIPPEFSQLDVADMVMHKLVALGKPLLCVPGNHDPYEILAIFNEFGTNLHGKAKEVSGATFAGWGGAPTPFNTIFEPSEGETKAALDALEKKVKAGFILVVHDPPKDTVVDKLPSGEHVGSKLIRDFIIKTKPSLVISAHIHEARGQDKLNSSAVFYPGPVYEGYYGIAEVGPSGVKCTAKKAKV